LRINTADFAAEIPGIFEAIGNVDVAVACVSEPGLVLVRTALRQKLEDGYRVRLRVDREEGATDPTALWELVTLNSEFPSHLLIKAYVPDQGILHSKVYISKSENDATLITGSANLSGAALGQNVEHGLRLVGTTQEPVITEATAEFERLWGSEHAFGIDAEAAKLYEIYAGLRRISLFAPSTDCNNFYLPTGLPGAHDSVVAEFVRGFAAASIGSNQ
jgi:HKD family nuclease